MRYSKQITMVLSIMLLSIATLAQKTATYTDASRLFEHAKMLYIKKQYVPAIQQFKQFLNTKPGPNFEYESEAYIGLARLKLDKQFAGKDLARLYKSQPEHKLNTEIILELGLYYFNKTKYTRALKYLEQVDESDVAKVRREELAFKKGYGYFKGGKYQQAKGEFKKVMNGNGKYAVEANYYYGYQCYILKDFACAIATFNKIGDKGPRTMQLYLAQMHYEQEEYEVAFDIIKDINLAKKENDIQLLKGKIQYQLGNISVALSHFNKYEGEIKELQSDEIYQFANANFQAENFKKSTEYFIYIANEDNAIGQSANYHLGISDVSSNQKERALNAFSEAKRKDFDKTISEISAFNYAKLAAELKKNSTAIGAIKEFLDQYPNSENTNAAKSIMADVFLTTKNYKAAIEILEDIGSLDNKSKKAYQELTFRRGEELYLDNQYQDAEVFFTKSLKYPKDKELEALSYFWRAEIAFKVDDNDESINLMNRFMSSSGSTTSKNKTYGYYSMGYNYFKKGDFPKAQSYFEKFKQYEKYTEANEDIYLNNTQRLADCYFLNGMYTEAIKEYDFIIKTDYKNSDYALFQQGMLYGLQERHSEKINVLKKIQQDFSGKIKSIYVDDALFQIASEYLILGNNGTADKMFNLIISQHDYSPYLSKSYLKLGLINYNQSNDAAALDYYKTVVERFPKTKESKEALAGIEIIFRNQGKPQDFIDYAQAQGETISVTFQDSAIYENAMQIYNASNFVGASKELDTYIKRFGDDGHFIIQAHYYKAECDFYTDKEDAALTHYAFVVDQGTNDFTEKSLIKLASTYFYRKKYTKSNEYYAKLEPIASSKSTFINAIKGQMNGHYLLAEYDQAKKKAIQLLPIEKVPTEDLVEANMVLGNIQLKSDNLRSAKYHFDYVIDHSRNSNTAEALYQRAYIRYEQNELDSAQSDVYRLQDDFSTHEYWVVKGFILLSDVYVKEGDLFQAKATLQSIVDNYKNEENGLLDICREKIKIIKEKENPNVTPELEEE